MSKSSWSGNRPKNDEAAINRLCDAALECFIRTGFEKTSMSDIAKEAGAARPTLYKYFKSKNEILFAAIDTAALTFAESVVEHAKQFPTYEERVTEIIIFVVAELPRRRGLSLIFNDQFSTVLRARAFSDEATLVFSQMTAAPLIEVRPELVDQGVEITEVMSRFAISMILFPGKYSSDINGLRNIIKKRILPGLI